MSEETLCINYACSSNLFTLKSNILAQDSDQLSFLHSINLLFGLRGPGSIPVLDSSQIWSLHVPWQLLTSSTQFFNILVIFYVRFKFDTSGLLFVYFNGSFDKSVMFLLLNNYWFDIVINRLHIYIKCTILNIFT